jgi:hypothetical protein
MTAEEWQAFVDFGQASTELLDRIIFKIKHGEPVSPEEHAVYQEFAEYIEQRLKKK